GFVTPAQTWIPQQKFKYIAFGISFTDTYSRRVFPQLDHLGIVIRMYLSHTRIFVQPDPIMAYAVHYFLQYSPVVFDDTPGCGIVFSAHNKYPGNIYLCRFFEHFSKKQSAVT